MTRPDWCPQRVWDEAVKATGSPDVYVGRLSALIMYERVSRAILAAEQRERAAIREIVATAPLSNRSDEPAISNKIMADWIDAQIANRGSEND